MLRELKPIVYIFCEWTTEYKYFHKVNQLYRETSVLIKEIKNLKKWWDFKNVRKLNSIILDKLKKNQIKWIKVLNKIYAVFDLDIFTKNEINNLYKYINKNIILIPSNQTFEYWILSHFEKYNLTLGKNNYIKIIKNKYIKNLTNDKFTWKNDFNWLNKENIWLAVKNVKSINKKSWDIKDRDPYSEVYKIIEFLDKHIKF